MSTFILDRGTDIDDGRESLAVKNICRVLKRDIDKVCQKAESKGEIMLVEEPGLEAEKYIISVSEEKILIYASEELGFEYGLLFISEKFLGVKPFWFWNEVEPDKKAQVQIPVGKYESPEYAVKYRGWFYNDEVLMMKWPLNERAKEGWRMAFEALLRCGGNMAIPGTDKLSRENSEIAAKEYGLWITHHHAEPLGAEMFVRAYPDLEANFFEHRQEFEKLWEEAVIRQKDYKVVWNICFRGQGDCPFWLDDTTGAFDTDEKRGKAISDIIQIQADIVKKYVENPIFCTNLYGEIMELYEQGYVHFPEGIIFVRADNGFGKMVTRRRGNHNPRVDAMPNPKEVAGQGIYYHVSFYDLQAAAQLSMLPNSVQFVNDELNEVLKNGGSDFWVINCSNVKPHTYFLDAVTKKWRGEEITNESQAKEFAAEYFDGDSQMAKCYADFADITPVFGENDDEHAGEQFYTENIRYIAHDIMVGKTDSEVELQWLTGEKPLKDQLEILADMCAKKLEAQKALLERIPATPGKSETLKLQVKMHYYGAKGVILFKEAYDRFLKQDYPGAFLTFGKCADTFEAMDIAMKESCKGIWTGFYDNDCQADYKYTAYMVRKLMGYVRELGDNPAHFKWQYDYMYDACDKGVRLILLTQNHATDAEIYQAMLKKEN